MNQKINEKLINLKEQFNKKEIDVNDVFDKLFYSDDLTDFVYETGLNADWASSEDISLYIEENSYDPLEVKKYLEEYDPYYDFHYEGGYGYIDDTDNETQVSILLDDLIEANK